VWYVQSKIVAGTGEAVDDSSLPYTLTAAATTNATLVKAGRGVITALHVINVNAAIRYLRFYDTNKVPTAGAGVPCRKYAIPGSATGAGFVLSPPLPMKFQIGIAFTLTTGVADTDATALTANDVVLTLEYV
jgi:hypothetical protein